MNVNDFMSIVKLGTLLCFMLCTCVYSVNTILLEVIFIAPCSETKRSSAGKILGKTPKKLAFKFVFFLISQNLFKLEVKYLNFINCIFNDCNLKMCVTQKGIGCHLSDDMKVSRYVAVQITQRDCCDIYCYDINCAFVRYSKNK